MYIKADLESSLLDAIKRLIARIDQKAKKKLSDLVPGTKTTFENYYKGINYSHVLIHPSLRAKETNLSEWTETWENNKLENLWIE